MSIGHHRTTLSLHRHPTPIQIFPTTLAPDAMTKRRNVLLYAVVDFFTRGSSRRATELRTQPDDDGRMKKITSLTYTHWRSSDCFARRPGTSYVCTYLHRRSAELETPVSRHTGLGSSFHSSTSILVATASIRLFGRASPKRSSSALRHRVRRCHSSRVWLTFRLT